jgi:hypothetical protein
MNVSNFETLQTLVIDHNVIDEDGDYIGNENLENFIGHILFNSGGNIDLTENLCVAGHLVVSKGTTLTVHGHIITGGQILANGEISVSGSIQANMGIFKNNNVCAMSVQTTFIEAIH